MVCQQCSKPSCLGNPWCSEWDCCASDPEFESDKKDFKGPPLKKTKSTVSRFSKPTSPTTMQTICKGYVPPNTQKATGWAVCVFNEWRAARNKSSDRKCPLNLLDDASASDLKYWYHASLLKLVEKMVAHIPLHLSTIFCLGFIGIAK